MAECYICIKKKKKGLLKTKIMKKLQTTAIILLNIEVSHIVFVRFNVPNDIPVVFHYDPNYNYHLIIKESAK